MKESKISIPEDLQQVCKDMAKIARKAGLMSFSGKFDPPISHEWRGSISFKWESGRYEGSGNEIEIHSDYHVFTKLTEK